MHAINLKHLPPRKNPMNWSLLHMELNFPATLANFRSQDYLQGMCFQSVLHVCYALRLSWAFHFPLLFRIVCWMGENIPHFPALKLWSDFYMILIDNVLSCTIPIWVKSRKAVGEGKAESSLSRMVRASKGWVRSACGYHLVVERLLGMQKVPESKPARFQLAGHSKDLSAWDLAVPYSAKVENNGLNHRCWWATPHIAQQRS